LSTNPTDKGTTPLHKESITQIRDKANGGFELSFITKDGEPYTINAYSLASQARPACLSWPKIIRHSTSQKPGMVSQGNRNRGKQTSLEGHHPVSAANQDQAYPRPPSKSNKQNGKASGNNPGNFRSGNFANTSSTTTRPHHETQIALAFAAALRKPKQ
jgi:hypothetical protein